MDSNIITCPHWVGKNHHSRSILSEVRKEFPIIETKKQVENIWNLCPNMPPKTHSPEILAECLLHNSQLNTNLIDITIIYPDDCTQTNILSKLRHQGSKKSIIGGQKRPNNCICIGTWGYTIQSPISAVPVRQTK